VAAECRDTPPTRLRARGAEVGGGRMSWHTPRAIASARGRRWVVAECHGTPPRNCEREGRRWVVAECHGTPHAIASARGGGGWWPSVMVHPHAIASARGGGGWWPSVMVHPHAIASVRGGGEWRPNAVIHTPRDCEHEGMSVTWRGSRGREGRQPSRGRQACGPRRCRGPPKARVTGVRCWFWSASWGTSGGPVEIVHIQDQAWFHWISGGTRQGWTHQKKSQVNNIM
jgi:hypothetical protein